MKDKKEKITKIIFETGLGYNEEDKEKLKKLIASYCRKRTGTSNSKIENVSGALLWVYSRINFLFEQDENWSQKSIAKKLNLKPKTISSKAGEIMNALKINFLDERFARKEVADKNPFKRFMVTQDGLIIPRRDNWGL